MAERKAQPSAKKAAVTKAASATAAKPKTTKAAPVAMPAKTAAKKTAATKPKATKTPAAKKAVMPAAKKATAQKTIATQAKPAAKRAKEQPSPEERYRMVQTAAYFIAEHNGFGGSPIDHWAAAELEIANRFGV